MGSGSTNTLAIIVAVLVLFLTGLFFLPGIPFMKQESSMASKAGEHEGGIGCPLPAEVRLEDSDNNFPTGLQKVDQRVLASGKTLETATLGLG